MNMVDHLTGPLGRVSGSAGESISKLQSLEQTFGGVLKSGAVMEGVGTAITGAVLAPVEATFETRRALGELASLGVQDLSAVENAAKDFSDQWAGTTKSDFISAAYDIKSGIASLSDEGVAQFTSLAALTAKATKSSAAEMTSLFATGYGIYKDYYSDLSDMEFGAMFSAGISKSVQQFKTTGSGMAQSVQSLGASATTANVPLEEQLSILGMLQATMGGAEAGTKYKAFLRSAAKGGEALGLSFLDANDQLLSMPEILDQLRGKFGETMDAAEKMELQRAFGDSESVALIDLMYSKTDDLQNNILTMYDALGRGTEQAVEMASAMNEMEPNQLEVIEQRLQNIAETAGNTLLPTINDTLDKVDTLIQRGISWVDNNQSLVRVFLLLALGLGLFLKIGGMAIEFVGAAGLVFTKTAGLVGGFIKVIKNLPDLFDTIRLYGMFAADGIRKGFSVIRSAGASAIGGIKNVAVSIAGMAKTAAVSAVTALKNMAVALISMAKQAITTAVTALPGLIASVWSFTAALLANPITWVVVGIVALIAVLILLWQNWDQVTAFLKGAWDGFCGGISAGVAMIQDGFASAIGWIQEKIAWFGDCGKKIIDTLVGGIKSVAMKPVEAIKSIFQRVRNLLPFSDAKEGPLSTLTLSGQRTMTTYAEGVRLAGDAPGEAVSQSLAGVGTSLGQKPIKKLSLGKTFPQEENADAEGAALSRDGVTIDKFYLNVDISKIKDLPMLLNLIGEIKKLNNGSGDGTPEPSPA